MHCDHSGESQQIIKCHNKFTLFILDAVHSVLRPGFHSHIFSQTLFNVTAVTTWLQLQLLIVTYVQILMKWLGLPLHCIASFTNHIPNHLSLDGVLSRQLLQHSFTAFFAYLHWLFSMCSPCVLCSTEMELFNEWYCASAFTNSCGRTTHN